MGGYTQKWSPKAVLYPGASIALPGNLINGANLISGEDLGAGCAIRVKVHSLS